jgi:hypothetical protein
MAIPMIYFSKYFQTKLTNSIPSVEVSHMRFMNILLVALALTAFVFGGCSGSSNPTQPASVNDDSRNAGYMPEEYCGEATTVALIAGKHTQVGEVIVTNDDGHLYIEYVVWAPWVLVETHVAVADSLAGIPQTKKGNPPPGQFPYNEDSIIDISQWCCGTPLYIAAHAVVQKLGPNGEILETQTGWGQGDRFPGKNWAMYFMHTIQCCPKEITLPSDIVYATLYHPGPVSYWKTVLSGIGPGYNVWDGEWVGWCVEQNHYLQPGILYSGHLYSSYDPGMPVYAQDPDWDMVNYIINHKNPLATLWEIQEAIWYFIDGGNWPSTQIGQDMVNDALANGEGYKPAAGEWIAVMFDPIENTSGDRSQLTIIEVDP